MKKKNSDEKLLKMPLIKEKDISYDFIENYIFTKEQEWAKESISHLEKEQLPEDKYSESIIEGKLSLKKLDHPFYDTIVLSEGNIKGEFQVPCSRCLLPADQKFDLSFSSAFVSESFEKNEELEDMTFLHDTTQYELFFMDKKKQLNLALMVQEQLGINLEPFPLHSPDCKGLCSQCGTNLNTESCKHHPQEQ